MENLLIVSGYFGVKSNLEVRPPGIGTSYFFANAKETLAEAELLGWSPVDVSSMMPLSSDEMVSSIQSKWLKFLGFLSDFPEFSDRTMIYADHKNQLTPNSVARLLKNLRGNAKVVVRHHAEYRDNVMMEVAEAWEQRRYAQNMPQTLEWIHERARGGDKFRTRVPNTGVLLWTPTIEARALASEIYGEILRLGQPECQIIWSMVSQRHKRHIRAIRYNSLGIRPKRHPGPARVALDRLVFPLRKALGRA